jgi:putative phosphoribosyl transferase
MLFRDRVDAGRRLAEKLSHYAGKPDVVVLALPRGGVPVAAEVARALDAPLDIFLVRKLGLPGQEELAMGAIASGGSRVLNTSLLRRLHVPPETINAVALRELRELDRRERVYRGSHVPPSVKGKTVILVDDGLATGASMHAAVTALRAQEPARIVVAVPVGAPSTCEDLSGIADEVVCAEAPQPFTAVGQWYDDFSQTSDDEVRQLLDAARRDNPGRSQGRPRADATVPRSGSRKGAFDF